MLLTFSEKPLGFLVWVFFFFFFFETVPCLPAVSVRKAIEMLSNLLVQQQESERQTFKSSVPQQKVLRPSVFDLSLP